MVPGEALLVTAVVMALEEEIQPQYWLRACCSTHVLHVLAGRVCMGAHQQRRESCDGSGRGKPSHTEQRDEHGSVV